MNKTNEAKIVKALVEAIGEIMTSPKSQSQIIERLQEVVVELNPTLIDIEDSWALRSALELIQDSTPELDPTPVDIEANFELFCAGSDPCPDFSPEELAERQAFFEEADQLADALTPEEDAMVEDYFRIMHELLGHGGSKNRSQRRRLTKDAASLLRQMTPAAREVTDTHIAATEAWTKQPAGMIATFMSSGSLRSARARQGHRHQGNQTRH